MPETTTEKVRAPKRTPKKWLEENGQGVWWSNLSDADKFAIAKHLRLGSMKDAADDAARIQTECEERVKAAQAKTAAATDAQNDADAVLSKCAKLTDTLNRK